MTQEHVFAKRS